MFVWCVLCSAFLLFAEMLVLIFSGLLWLYVSYNLGAPGRWSFEHLLQRLFVKSNIESASSACDLLALPTYSIPGVAQCTFKAFPNVRLWWTQMWQQNIMVWSLTWTTEAVGIVNDSPSTTVPRSQNENWTQSLSIVAFLSSPYLFVCSMCSV